MAAAVRGRGHLPCAGAATGRGALGAASRVCGALAVWLAGAGWANGDKLAQRAAQAGLGALAVGAGGGSGAQPCGWGRREQAPLATQSHLLPGGCSGEGPPLPVCPGGEEGAIGPLPPSMGHGARP